MDFAAACVTEAREELSRLRCLVRAQEAKLQRDLLELQRQCDATEEGHAFVGVPDGDCHKPGVDYTCCKCGYWTANRREAQGHMRG